METSIPSFAGNSIRYTRFDYTPALFASGIRYCRAYYRKTDLTPFHIYGAFAFI